MLCVHFSDENYPTRDLVFLGLISLVDPPKETVPGAIAMCRSAGVRVVMVTGDHPLTAAAIARQVGIITGNTREELAKIHGVPPSQISEDQVDAVVIRGSDLDKWTQADWDLALCKPEVVFARTTPSQKLQIVENLQRLGNIVAVTGDGVNECVVSLPFLFSPILLLCRLAHLSLPLCCVLPVSAAQARVTLPQRLCHARSSPDHLAHLSLSVCCGLSESGAKKGRHRRGHGHQRQRRGA